MRKQNEETQWAKKQIEKAYFSLLKKYGVEDSENISISEIAAHANVSRMAYYRNFHRKSEIVEFYFRESLWQSFDGKDCPFWSQEYGVHFFSMRSLSEICHAAISSVLIYITPPEAVLM
jgi:uncharacterized protein (DUF2132 family)